MNNTKAPIKLLWCVVMRNQVDDACAILDQMGGCTLIDIFGYRTKTQILADLFGLGDYDCAVVLAMVPSNRSTQILDALNKKFDWENKLGIGITTQINAISRNALNGFFDMQKQIEQILFEQEQAKSQKEKKEEITTPQGQEV